MTIDQLNEVKRNNPIVSVLRGYGVKINSKGFCKCIFHDDKRASMKIYADQDAFYCYSCNKYGDTLDYVMQYNNCDLKSAYHLLGGTNKELTWAEKQKIKLEQEKREKYRLVLNDVNRRIAETEMRIAECERGIKFEGMIMEVITDNMVDYGLELIKAERDLAMYENFKHEWIRDYERYI